MFFLPDLNALLSRMRCRKEIVVLMPSILNSRRARFMLAMAIYRVLPVKQTVSVILSGVRLMEAWRSDWVPGVP